MSEQASKRDDNARRYSTVDKHSTQKTRLSAQADIAPPDNKKRKQPSVPLPDDFLNVNLDALDGGVASKSHIRRKKSKSMAEDNAL